MKTLTPEQRIEGFTELEGVLGEGGVGGAHLMSFLAGIAHAEKVLAELAQGEEPIGQVGKCHTVTWFNKPEPLTYLYSQPVPRPEPTQDEAPVGTLDHNGNFKLLRMIGIPISQPMKLYEHPASRPEFVRLSEEEVDVIEASIPPKMGLNVAKKLFADRIQDLLEEKNRG